MERDKIALEAMKIFLNHQGTRTRNLKSRVMLFFGIDGWSQKFTYNSKDIANNSYEMADQMIQESKEIK